ncbi:hypothetical protein [Streptomyces bugieae]|uniref:hypothetical protein n=1 Tax=Streptomyces bugieae TaxID=3098223 RepID=UPI002ED5E06B
MATSSWHTPTDEVGWRLYGPNGGERPTSPPTPLPRPHLPPVRQLPDLPAGPGDCLLPQISTAGDVIDCGWCWTHHLNQLVHVNGASGGR